MAIQIQLRRGTAAEWASANTVLALAEMGIETDTKKFKIGDGTTSWTALAYGGIKGDTGATGAKGDKGVDGIIGSDGAKGDKGDTGTTGAAGAKGDKGDTGSAGSKGDTGSFGGASFLYDFSTNTSNTYPASGQLKFNNSTLASATKLWIGLTDSSSPSVDISSFLQTIDDSTSSIKGHFRLSALANSANYVLFTITGSQQLWPRTNSVFLNDASYVTTPNSGTALLGSGNYTVETWIKTTDTSFELIASQSSGLAIFVTSGTMHVQPQYGVAALFTASASSILDNNWHHVALVRNSNTVKLYFDGVEQGSGTNSRDYSSISNSYDIGYGNQSAGRYLNGYLSNFRIVNGTAVYTGAFTPPTSPLTAITNTTLLTFQDSTLIDNSSGARTLTPTGTPTYGSTVVPFSGGWYEVPVGYVSGSSSSFSDAAEVLITFARTGDVGDKGQKGEIGPVGGSNTQILFNDSSTANSSAVLTFNKTTNAFGAPNTTITGFANVTSTIQGGAGLTIAGAASGITTLAAGNTTITGFANVTSTIQGGAGLTIAGAASGITTLAAGNTTITGFANVTSTIQGGAGLTIAGAASGITTLAAGNTTVTGFANVSSTLQVTGVTTLSANIVLGTTTITANGSVGSAGAVLTSGATGNVYWAAASGGGATLTANSTDTQTFYLPMANTTSGSWSNAVVSTSKLYFVPSTGTLNSTVFNSLSDKNFKTDLMQIEDALEKLKQLTGYTYTLVDSGERSAGLLSQDANNVLPESVREKDGVQSLNYNAIVGLIVESIKILSDKVDSINDRLG